MADKQPEETPEAAPPKRRGGFQKGVSGNPKGRTPGGQDFITRAHNMLEMMSVGEIVANVQALRSDKNSKEYKKVMKMAARDLVIQMRIADAFMSGGGQGLDRLLDRIVGKPTQQISIDQRLNGTVEHFSVSEIDQWLKETIG